MKTQKFLIRFACSLLLTTSSFTGAEAKESSEESTTQKIPLLVTEKGFEPSQIKVKPGTHVILQVTRKTDETCATEIKVKERKINQKLPLNKQVHVDLGILKAGEIKFACGMNMITGHILTE